MAAASKSAIGSDNPARPWTLTAAVTPTRQGFRKFQLEARKVSISDLLLASRLDDRGLKIDTPLSASISGEIGPDGLPQMLDRPDRRRRRFVGRGDDAT